MARLSSVPDYLAEALAKARAEGRILDEKGVADLTGAAVTRGPPPPPPPEGCKESTFQDHLRMLALWGGWRYYHTRDSRKSDPDFPDTVCARAGRLAVLELKVNGREATPGQLEWLRLFGLIPGVTTGVYYPEDWEKLVEVLR